MKVVVRNLRRENDSQKFYFDIVKMYERGDYEFDYECVKSSTYHLMTDFEGCGLFWADNFYCQYIGTFDFSLSGKSVEAARKYIYRHLIVLREGCYDGLF